MLYKNWYRLLTVRISLSDITFNKFGQQHSEKSQLVNKIPVFRAGFSRISSKHANSTKAHYWLRQQIGNRRIWGFRICHLSALSFWDERANGWGGNIQKNDMSRTRWTLCCLIRKSWKLRDCVFWLNLCYAKKKIQHWDF